MRSSALITAATVLAVTALFPAVQAMAAETQYQMQVRVAGLKSTESKPAVTGKSCQTILDAGGSTGDGIYTVQPTAAPAPFEVYCDMTTDGGGWAVLQNRFDGSVGFARDWAAYKAGFGSLSGEFWLGNDNLHYLAGSGAHLKVRLWEGATYGEAHYTTFSVNSESDNYRMSVSGYSGTAGDALAYHNGQMFTTHDQDNDVKTTTNCSQSFGNSAWWYKSCYVSNLNGIYGSNSNNGNTWVTTSPFSNSVAIDRTIMMLR